MADAIQGSIEIKTADGLSIGVQGQRWTLEAVPLVLETLHGITGMETVEPEEQPTGRTPMAQWEAVDANNQDVIVLLWEDIPYEATAVAKAIAAAIAQEDAPNGK